MQGVVSGMDVFRCSILGLKNLHSLEFLEATNIENIPRLKLYPDIGLFSETTTALGLKQLEKDQRIGRIPGLKNFRTGGLLSWLVLLLMNLKEAADSHSSEMFPS